jgi:integrase
MKLTDIKVRSLIQPGKYADGGGLYFQITEAGGRYWRLKFRVHGKEKKLALGVYPAVTLKEARNKAAEAKKKLQGGIDPAAERKAEKLKAAFNAENTLEAVAYEYLNHQSTKWAAVTRERIESNLKRDIFSSLGSRPISDIKPRELKEAIKRIESRGVGDQAARVLQRVKAIYRWAVLHDRIEVNPMLDLLASEIMQPRTVQHRPALSDSELPEFMQRLDLYGGEPVVVAALKMLMLTATRSGELRGMRWDEIDFDSKVWHIPAQRMKMKEAHKVPLSKQALQVIESMRSISGKRELIFPSPYYPSKPISENTPNSALSRMGYKNKATAHGFRSLFCTVANEAGWRADVIERQMAHKEKNAVRAAYHHASYLEERTRLMQWWADYVDARAAGLSSAAGMNSAVNVISIQRAA